MIRRHVWAGEGVVPGEAVKGNEDLEVHSGSWYFFASTGGKREAP